MKIELVSGCICDYLGIDGISEVDMTDEQRKYYNDKICDFLKQRPQDLNYLLQDIVERYGECEWDDKPCECCGDTVITYTLEIED